MMVSSHPTIARCQPPVWCGLPLSLHIGVCRHRPCVQVYVAIILRQLHAAVVPTRRCMSSLSLHAGVWCHHLCTVVCHCRPRAQVCCRRPPRQVYATNILACGCMPPLSSHMQVYTNDIIPHRCMPCPRNARSGTLSDALVPCEIESEISPAHQERFCKTACESCTSLRLWHYHDTIQSRCNSQTELRGIVKYTEHKDRARLTHSRAHSVSTLPNSTLLLVSVNCL